MKLNYRASAVLIVIVSLLSALPLSAAENDEKIPAAADANQQFTPLVLPEDAAQTGISLSGETKMYRIAPAHYELSCGCALVHTEQAIEIKTCRAEVLVRPGASIVIGAKKDATRILNLSDRKHDSVRVIFSGKHISLNPGEELAVVAASASEEDHAANEYVIRYRNAETIAVSPEYKALLFEFSLGDAMKHCLIFKQLSSSPRAQDKLLLSEIIKTAAAVNTMFAKSRDKYGHGDDDSSKTDSGRKLASRKKSQS